MGQRVVIVGGGSAGWMTASYLIKALPRLESVTLIESANIRTIGVGEATFSTIKLFFDFLDLREQDWMPHCSGAYKLAIRFVNWTNERGHFYHPFQRFEVALGYDAAEWWLKLKRGEEPFDYACFTIPWLCDAMRSPRYLDGTVFDEKVRSFYDDGAPPPNASIAGHQVQYPYAYHFNAAELALFLQQYAVDRGVARVVDEVVDVTRREDGSIAGVHTKEHGLIEGDLFVDCTGFRGLLINKTLNEPFISFADSLLNDSAVAIQVPRDIERDGIKPYTTAHAHNAGWSWNIPLYGRDGTGYVYCSQFIDQTEAEREFREFLGPAADGSPANHIKMRIGRCRNSWVKNCVAIGLASGFVEPLESTGIFFIQHGIEELVNHFPADEGLDENLIASYNKIIGECIDGIREFLTIHYFASDRADTPFWKATKHVIPPDSLRERLELWRSRLPCQRSIYQPYHGFETYSWAVMLLGLNYQPRSYRPRLDHLDATAAQRLFDSTRREAERLVTALPSQYEYLTHMRGFATSGLWGDSSKTRIRATGEVPAAGGTKEPARQ
jgi:tryptophan 6-halogenase